MIAIFVFFRNQSKKKNQRNDRRHFVGLGLCVVVVFFVVVDISYAFKIMFCLAILYAVDSDVRVRCFR